ncbi:histidine phosphatase superfamily [Halenospora varia]|nr:histidine phosphatase superfamily [Halenospora varia]
MARASQHSLQQDFIARRRPHLRICSINRFVPFLFLATVIVAFMVMMGESPQPAPEYIKYSTVTGYFQQDDHNTDDKKFDYTISNFGLIDRSYDSDPHADPDGTKTQWERFEHEVARLNRESGSKTQYKVLYMGRHGEGYHNVAEAFYGSRDWDCYWSLQDGNETSTWVDARLTPIGIAQAQKANAFWHLMITIQKIPTPELYYTSPLMRCLATAEHTFSGLKLPEHKPFKPLIKELIREAIGAHTCDMRSTKTEIQKAYPDWPIEPGFAEEDPLWDPELRETNEAMDIRLREALDGIFSSNEKTFISISSHSGAIGSILRVLEHRNFSLGTGQVIPVLVKAERVSGEGPSREKGPYTTISRCPMPTATSTLPN